MSIQISGLNGLLPKTNCRFTWRELTLTDTNWASQKSYDLSADLSLERAVAVLSEGLSFCEKLSLAEAAASLTTNTNTNTNSHTFDQRLFFKESNYTRFDLIEQIKNLSKELPEDFLRWCALKKLNLKDFRAFLNDYKKNNDSVFFSKLSDLDPTKNTGLQIIEVYFDLCAQKKVSPEDLLSFKNAETLLASLKKKRFSMTLSKDQIIFDELSKIKVAAGVKASLKRNGDKKQIKLELEADSPEQLKEKLQKSLERADSFEKAWNIKSGASK